MINFTVKTLVQAVLVQNFRVLARDLKKLFRERNAYKSSESAKHKNTKRYEMKGYRLTTNYHFLREPDVTSERFIRCASTAIKALNMRHILLTVAHDANFEEMIPTYLQSCLSTCLA